MFIQQRLLPSPGSVKLIQRTIIRRTLAASASNSDLVGMGARAAIRRTVSNLQLLTHLMKREYFRGRRIV